MEMVVSTDWEVIMCRGIKDIDIAVGMYYINHGRAIKKSAGTHRNPNGEPREALDHSRGIRHF
jgi:hypothetical protein